MSLKVVDGDGVSPTGGPPGGGVGGDFDEDVIAKARKTIAELMGSGAGRGSMVRLLAAQTVLKKDYLTHLSDEDLLAEVRRRAAAAKRTKSPPPPEQKP